MAWPRLALAVLLPALLAVRAAAGEPALEVPVLWVETGGVPPAVRETMAREAAEILGGAGVNLRWRVGPPEVESGPEELRVVALPTTGRRTRTGRVLGATSTGEGPRTIWIDYANVAWVAGSSAESLTSAGFRERRRAGVAMGRVVAHEVIHVLLPGMPHARGGVMAERLLGALEKPLRLDAHTREAVRAASASARDREGEVSASSR
jgi:hypothetical protein